MAFPIGIQFRLLGIVALTLALVSPGGNTRAQTSLPLDIDLSANDSETELSEDLEDRTDDGAEVSAEDPIEPSSTPEASTEDPIEVVPLTPPAPLRPTSNISEDVLSGGEAGPVEDPLPNLSEPPGEMLPLEPEPMAPSQGVTATVETEDLASFLVGQKVDTAIAMLERDGWLVTARTPGLVQLDRGQLGLDLEVDGSTGQVVEVKVIDLT